MLTMFTIDSLSVKISEKPILDAISLELAPGEVIALLGKNGSGKSTLAAVLMRHPRYEITAGTLTVDGVDITTAAPDALSALGVFLSFQNVPEIPGIRLIEYLRTVYSYAFSRTHPGEKVPTPFVFRRMVEKLLPEFGIAPSFLDRDLYVGFSGGEKRRIEMLQIELLSPRYIILDEIDSGLDIGALELLSSRVAHWRTAGKMVLIISHNFHLLDTIAVDRVAILDSG